MKCPDCDGPIKPVGISRSKFFLASCLNCSEIFLIDSETSTTIHRETIHICEQIPENIPPLELGTFVYIVNKEHLLFLEQGTIEEKGHLHYRLKLASLVENLNNTKIWVPQHWVKELPQELMRSSS